MLYQSRGGVASARRSLGPRPVIRRRVIRRLASCVILGLAAVVLGTAILVFCQRSFRFDPLAITEI
jgi:hypothetical protein